MSLNLEELATHIVQTFPSPRAITHLEQKPNWEAITFHWQGRRFVVRTSLQVLEMRRDRVFITGASMLAQSVLVTKTKQANVLESVVKTLREAEELIGNPLRVETGLKLLTAVKSSLRKLIESKRPKHPHPRAAHGPGQKSGPKLPPAVNVSR